MDKANENNSIPSSSIGNNSNTTQLSKGLTKELANNSTELANDCISRQAAIDAVRHAWAKGLEPSQYIEELPSAQPEPLTDKEQRIFLAAMGREEKVCAEVDRNYIRQPYEDSLMSVCREIIRKVKGALWT